MKKITVITNSDHDSILQEFTAKLSDEINIFEKELYNSKTLVFENIGNLAKMEFTSCEVFIIEDDINTVLKYLRILRDAPLVQNIIVTTKPKTTQTVLDFLNKKNILDKISAIFLDFDLNENPSNPQANSLQATINFDKIYSTYFRNEFYPPKVIAITAYEGVENNYSDLQQRMRENDDFVISKGFLTEKKAVELFKSILKSIPGIYWNKVIPERKKAETTKSNIDNSIAEYENKNPEPKNIEYGKILLENIETAMPDIFAKTKFEISKHANTIKKPNKEEKFSSQQTLGECIEGAAIRIIWLLNHPTYRSSFPKFRHQFNTYGLFKTQITKGGANKK